MRPFIGTVAAAMAFAGSAAADEIIFAHGENPGNPRHLAAERFAELVETCEGSDLTVNVAPSATMGDDVEMLTATIAGIVQITANSQGPFAQIVPEAGAIGLPFLFEDAETAWAVLDGEIGGRLDALARENRLTILAFWDNGIRHVSHLNRPVDTPAALSGMQIRTPSDEMTIAMFEALGASPAPLAFSELPSALQAGAFDGQENPLTNIHSARLHQITPHITLTGHQYQATPVVAGLDWWTSLDEASRSCVRDAAREAGRYQRELSRDANAELLSTMAGEGAIFSEVADRGAFIAASAPVYADYERRLGDFVPALVQAAAR